jgi:hypothetical protein
MQTCTSAMDRFHVTKSTSAAKKAISMRLKTFVNLVLVTIVVTPTALFSQTSIANSPLAITAKAIDSPEPALEFSVTNVSSTAVSIYLAELPWSGEMVLVAKPDDAPPRLSVSRFRRVLHVQTHAHWILERCFLEGYGSALSLKI